MRAAVTIAGLLLVSCGGGGSGVPAGQDAATGADILVEDAAGADTAPTFDGLPPGLKVVMVTNGAPALTAGDMLMANRLRDRGFEVAFASDVAVTADSVAGQDLVLISSSAESGPLGTKLRDVGLPVVCIENGAFPTMGLTGTMLATDYGSTFNQTAVVIAADAPAWAGLLTSAPSSASPSPAPLTGTVTIASTPAELGWAVPSAAAAIAATLADNPAHAALFAYATGSPMPGLAAPARRVGFAIRETAAANLTADGLALFDAAVTFALAPAQ